MVWVWWIAGILVAGLLFFMISDVQMRFRFTRMEGDDQLWFDIRGLYGFVRFRFAVPVLVWRDGGLHLKSEKVDRKAKELLSGQHMNITRDEVELFFRRTRDLLTHTDRLIDWLKGVLARTTCTEISWTTRIGLGDAADTAVTTGIVWGIKTSVLGYLFRYIKLEAKPVLSVQPQFNRMQFSTAAVCTAKIKAGYALYAGILLVFRILRVKGGLKTWRKVLFKPS
ncbi:DUF2953 domain-containing protein [Paenibacillus flagellatus]|uniref:DUF2953 domain-containing protein n=1 Tax=Paenibacillus flagellatus TaxID=2211139 RepID=A0A2V5KA99_9BACL|nr:DUF2953 domain-containing protein [Paenibacillus flagellatus]PYI54994.1 hypothetical protein DLM86_10655 [Paenibacillus flagellatus]